LFELLCLLLIHRIHLAAGSVAGFEKIASLEKLQ
jgi:hypothetical protein